MSEFLDAVGTYAFMRNALLTGLLASIACGVVGSFVVVKRISYIAGGIAHCVLGGIGAALYLERVHGFHALDPLHGALVAALLAAFVIGLVSLRAKQRVDTVIGAVWAIGMAAGVLFISRMCASSSPRKWVRVERTGLAALLPRPQSEPSSSTAKSSARYTNTATILRTVTPP